MVARFGFPSQDAVTRFERGVAKTVSLPFLCALARFAVTEGTSIEWVLTGTEIGRSEEPSLTWLADAGPDELTGEFARAIGREQHIAQFVRLANDRRARRRLAEAMAPPGWQPPWPRLTTGERLPRRVDVEDLPADWRGKYVPIVAGVAASKGSDTVQAEQEAMEYVACEGAPDGAFAVEVFSECMMPQYEPGDLVVVDPRCLVESGLAVVLYRGQFPGGCDRCAKLRILRRVPGEAGAGRVLLESTNRRKPIDLPADRLIAAYAVWRHLPAGGRDAEGAEKPG